MFGRLNRIGRSVTPSRPRSVAQELERRVLLSATMVKDITVLPAGGSLARLAQLGDVLLFASHEPGTGEELYRTDGTRQGTALVKDINPGPASSGLHGVHDIYFGPRIPEWAPPPSGMTVFRGKGYFAATDNTNAVQDLWVTDGTPGGTQRLTDFRASAAGVVWDSIVAGNDLLYFTRAPSGAQATELWKTDGTAAGAIKVADLPPRASDFVTVGNTLYFISSDSAGRSSLWRSDGTAAGTVRVSDINPNNYAPISPALQPVGNDLFFTAFDAAAGLELWKTNATTGGVGRVKDINPGSGGSEPDRFTVVGNTLFFVATDPTGGRELWKSDGTEAGTVRVKDQVPGPGSFSFGYMLSLGGRLFFQRAIQGGLYVSDGTEGGTTFLAPAENAGTHPPLAAELNGVMYIAGGSGVWESGGKQLFRTDGTPAGTVLLKQFPYPYAGVFSMVTRGGTLFLIADDGASGRELWRSDGTPGGTVRVTDINPGAGHAVRDLFALPGGLVLTADDGVHGEEPWVSDGTVAGTVPAGDLHSGTRGTHNGPLTSVGGALYFPVNFSELWRSDGTDAGTYLVKDISPAAMFSSTRFADVGGTLFFETYAKLWKSDGTAGGTVVVRDFAATSGDPAASVQYLTALGGTLFFVVRLGNGSCELWKTDGTPGGTAILTRSDGWIRNLAVAFGRVFFSAYQPDTGDALWTTDGTVGNTRLFKDLFPGPDNIVPFRGTFTPFNGMQLFHAGDAFEVWQTDGTPEGTVRAQGIRIGRVLGPYMYWLQAAGSGAQLWRGDGTPNGAELVKELAAGPGAPPAIWADLVAAGGRLFFEVRAGTNRYTLYTSDGTSDGTRAVGELSFPKGPLVPFNNSVYQVAGGDGDGANGQEIYRSDGTPEGTGLMQQIGPGPLSSRPSGLTVLGDTLFFWADDSLHGNELWKFTPPRVAAAAFDPAARPGGLRVSFSFSEDVRASLTEADLVVRPVGSLGGTAIRAAAWSYHAATRTATFTFNPGDLPAGDYTATLDGRGVRDALGNALPGDSVLRFFVLPGDINRDRAVNGIDFALLAGNFGKPGMTYDKGDLNGDGAVNGSDFAILAGNFGRTLPPEPAVASATVSTSPAPASTASPSPTPAAAPVRRPPPRVRTRARPMRHREA